MSLALEHTDDPPQDVTAPSSVLDRVRARHKQAQKAWHLDLAIPGYGNPSDLAVRYRALDPDVDDIDQVIADRNDLDVLIAACECILVRGENGELEPLNADGQPVRFDERLAEILELNVPSLEDGGTARDVLIQAFATVPSPRMAADKHIRKFLAWMESGDRDVTEVVLGES